VIRERASKVVSLAFSKLYYACVVNDSRDRTVSFIKDVYVYPINVNNRYVPFHAYARVHL